MPIPLTRRAAAPLAVFALLLPLLTATGAAAVDGPAGPVFINEIHYDNVGTDTGEFIEVAGPAGTDLTGWSIVLYNGNGGGLYDTDPLAGVIPGPTGRLRDGRPVVPDQRERHRSRRWR